MRKLKQKKGSPGRKLKPDFKVEPYPQFEHPVFCFRYLSKKYGLEQCDKNEKAALIVQLYQLSQMTWTEIKMAGRHGCGSEKINPKSLKASIPNHLSMDVNLYALRFMGFKAFVGYRTDFIFHILYIDTKFNLYNH
jgi:hypothetical protein